MSPICPNCGAALPKAPQRKSKCKACGEFIHIKSTPDNREKRLMTPAQAAEADAAWAHVQQEQIADATASRFDIHPRAFADAVAAHGSIDAAVRAILMPRAQGGDLRAIQGMASVAESAADRLYWQRLGIEGELAHCRAMGLGKVQLRVLPYAKCAVCESRSHEVIATSVSAAAVIPANCPRLDEAECAIYISTAIRAADGSQRREGAPQSVRQPTPAPAYQAGRHAGSLWKRFVKLMLGTKR